MTLLIELPAEIEQVLRLRAQAVGLDVGAYVTHIVQEELADDLADKPNRRMSREEIHARLQKIIDLHPISTHFVDDSRESIYEGCGE